MVRGLRPAGEQPSFAGQRQTTLALDGPVVMERLLEPANRQ
jgi:hypothetical protein